MPETRISNSSHDPDIHTVGGNLTLNASSRYSQHITTTIEGVVVTVPAGESYRFVNKGAIPFSIALSGAPSQVLNPGQSMIVSWDVESDAHVHEAIGDHSLATLTAAANYSALRASSTVGGQVVAVAGRLTEADGGEGMFVDIGPRSSLPGIAEDGGYQFFTTGDTRVVRRIGPAEPKHFGATPFPSDRTGAEFLAAPNDAVPLQAWFDAHKNSRATLAIPGKDQYRSDATLTAHSQKPNILLEGHIVFDKRRDVGIELRDERNANLVLEGTVHHRFRVFRYAGPARTDPNWTTYDYATKGDEAAVNGSGELVQETLWKETDIGVRCVAVHNSLIEVEARNFAIGCCVDTDETISTANGGGFTSRSHFKPLVMYNNKTHFVVRARHPDNGWANEITVGAKNINLESSTLPGATTKARYGFVVMGDPSGKQVKRVAADKLRHVPDGITLLGSFESADHSSSDESVVAWIVDGRGVEMEFRNDLPTYKMLMVNNEPNNRGYTLKTEKVFSPDQIINRSGGDFRWEAYGRGFDSTQLVDARNLRRRIVPNDDTSWRVQGPYLEFQRSNSTPQETGHVSQLSIVDDEHIDNFTSADAISSTIGATIELGEGRFGGYLQIHSFKDDDGATSNGRITVMAYDASGGIITPTAANWTVRDCADSPGPMLVWPTAHGHVSYRNFNILNNRTYRLRFGPNVATVFVAVGGDKLSGFVIEAIDYPGCKVVRKRFDGFIADQKPTHGKFLEPIEIRNSDPSSPVEGWRLRTTNGQFPVLGAHDWAIGLQTTLGRVFKVSNDGDAWEVTTVGATSLTVGAPPSGTGPTHTDAHGNVYTKRAESAAAWTVINIPLVANPRMADGADLIRTDGSDASFPRGTWFREADGTYVQT